jgi:tRNA threonylcarbamoyladenosine modification (KEOPS) complex  Pcc1 subunit
LRSKVRYVTLEVELAAEKRVISSLLSSLAPEAIKSKRLDFIVTRKKDGKTLTLRFSAADLVSVRAGMNTILRLALSALKSIREVSELEPKGELEITSQKD